MHKILVLFAHPRFEQSRVNSGLVQSLGKTEGVTFHDLYERYPDFNIDIELEKSLLEQHDVIIWHHPLYWYSCPPLLKQWIDMVLEYGWAYGSDGGALAGKICLNAITTGGTREVYCSVGRNRYTLREFLRPFEQTARLCQMDYLPPFAVMGTHQLQPADIDQFRALYISLIEKLQGGNRFEGYRDAEQINDVVESSTNKGV